jgi:uncharacterized protein (DUF342 family)
MYCRLEAIGNLELTGKRGVLVGGTSIIHTMLKATTIGTDSHISTQISMSNSDPELENRLTALQNRLRELDAEQLKLTQIVNRVIDLAQKGRATPDMIATVSTAKNTKAQLDSEQAITAKKLEEARTEQMRRNRENNCYIECKGRVHAGVVLTFGPLIMPVQSSFVFSRVSVVNDDISIVPLG